jgi:hypothetical protein
MKKKFTLFALALLSVVAFAYQTTRASGDPTVLYSWESPDGTVVETGGTATYENGDGDRLNYKQSIKISEEVSVNYYTMCLNGKKANIDDATASANAGHMLITLDEELKEGETARDGQLLASAHAMLGQAVGDGDRECIHGQACAENGAAGNKNPIHHCFFSALCFFKILISRFRA